MGNHEGQGELFEKYFPYPMFEYPQFYYSFDYANAHFIILDQEIPFGEGSTQYEWLVNDLQTTDKQWKILLMHKPGWSAGGGHSNNTYVQIYIQPLCLEYNIPFVITGHNHYYARAVVNGVEHITTGGGGAPLYTPNPTYDSIVTVDKSYHFCKLDIDKDTLTFTAIRYDGSIIESFKYINSVTGITAKADNDVKVNVYSVNSGINVINNENRPIIVKVYDIEGRLVNSSRCETSRKTIPVNNKGVYIVNILTESGKTYNSKVVLR